MNREVLYEALRNADAAGDVEAATKLAEYIQSLPPEQETQPAPQQPEQPEQPSTLQSAIQGIGQGVTGGWGDELLAGVMTPIAQLSGTAPEGETWGETYQTLRDIGRERASEAQAAHPVAYGAGEVGGSIVPAGAATRVAGSAARGATAAGLGYGLGKSEGEVDAEEAGKIALRGLASGAIAGVPSTIGRGVEAGKRAITSSPTVQKGWDVAKDVAKETGKEMTEGTAGTAIGGIAGFAAGGPVGAAGGIATQKALKKLAEKPEITDKLTQIAKKVPKAFGKFADAVSQAVEKGGQAFPALHFQLSQSSPEYAETVRKVRSEYEMEDEKNKTRSSPYQRGKAHIRH